MINQTHHAYLNADGGPKSASVCMHTYRTEGLQYEYGCVCMCLYGSAKTRQTGLEVLSQARGKIQSWHDWKKGPWSLTTTTQHSFSMLWLRSFLNHFHYSSFTHATSFLRVSKVRQVKWSGFKPGWPQTSKTKSQWLDQHMADRMQLPTSSVKTSNRKGRAFLNRNMYCWKKE